MQRHLTIAKHYALCAVWAVLPVSIKGVLYRRHRARNTLFN